MGARRKAAHLKAGGRPMAQEKSLISTSYRPGTLCPGEDVHLHNHSHHKTSTKASWEPYETFLWPKNWMGRRIPATSAHVSGKPASNSTKIPVHTGVNSAEITHTQHKHIPEYLDGPYRFVFFTYCVLNITECAWHRSIALLHVSVLFSNLLPCAHQHPNEITTLLAFFHAQTVALI